MDNGADEMHRSTVSTTSNALHIVQPHQFRSRNDLIKTQRTQSNAGEAAVKSTSLVDILPLITVWLQVRVLAGPPVIAGIAGHVMLRLHAKNAGADSRCSFSHPPMNI
jgi:hypothetical protein